MSEAFRCGTDEQKKALGVDESYQLLVGPDGFWTFLGEPENRSWHIDGQDVVRLLNKLYQELINANFRAKNCAELAKKFEDRLVQMTTRAETAERERDALIAENALTQRACDSWRKMAMDRLDERNALAKENEWHPASVRPELHEHVMTIDSMGQLHIDFWYPTENRFWSERDGDDDEKITHWRELPQPPKGEAT